MSVLAIEDTIIDNNHVTVTAVVDNMRLLYRQTMYDPAEYAPAVCTASFDMDEGEQIPVDENGFCSYLTDLDLDWEPIDCGDDE